MQVVCWLTEILAHDGGIGHPLRLSQTRVLVRFPCAHGFSPSNQQEIMHAMKSSPRCAGSGWLGVEATMARLTAE